MAALAVCPLPTAGLASRHCNATLREFAFVTADGEFSHLVIGLIGKAFTPKFGGEESLPGALAGDLAAGCMGRNVMARRNRIDRTVAITPASKFTHPASDDRARTRRAPISAAARALVVASLVCLASVGGWAQQTGPQPSDPQRKQQSDPQRKPTGDQQRKQQNDQQQMRGLDEQIQEVKSDVLRITAELLYPSGTQVAVFVALAKDDTMRLDAVRLTIDGQLAAHYIYSFKELEALRKGGVQRIYVGNVATGDHQLEVLVDGKLKNGSDFSRTDHFAFRKDVKPKLVGLTLAGPDSGSTPIVLGEW
jgi:hypothetical protein